LSTAKTPTAKVSIQYALLIFWVTRFGLVRLETAMVSYFLAFPLALSRLALKSMASTLRKSQLRNWTHCTIDDIGKRFNPVLRGWINYYGRYRPSALHALFRLFNRALVSWVMAKYRRFRNKKTRAGQYLARIAEARPELFVHWHMGIRGAFV